MAGRRIQYAVIGLGRFGSSLAEELMQLGYEVLGIDQDEQIVNDMSARLTHAVVADCTDEDVLKSIGIRNFDCVVVAIGTDIQASIMTTILLKDLGVKKVVAKALSVLHGKVLNKIGVDRIIFPERDMGIRVAHQLSSPNLLDFIELSKEYTIAEMTVPRKWSGWTLRQINPRAKYGCSVVAVNKNGKMIIVPSAEDVVNENDILVAIGTNEQIEHFQNSLSEE